MVLTFGLFDAGNDWWWAIDNIVVTGKWSGVRASHPNPSNGAEEVAVKSVLSWTPGEYAGGSSPQHRVLLSNDVNAVNEAAAVVSTVDANSYDATGHLDFSTTYYWRIDEANSVTGWDEGSVWSFTTESLAYPLTGVTATASSAQANMGPEKTIDGSGLTGDLHGADGATMWLSTGTQPNWIQYQFDKVYKLHELKVWNSNQLIESFLGFGAKSVTIETSTDGATWTALANVPEFVKAPGMAGYAANTTVNLGRVVAKYVKLTINSTWGGMGATGLSEVRFSYIPVQAREPEPANGETGVSVDTALGWRAGREAASHKVYFSSDKQAVTDGTAAVHTVGANSYTPDGLLFASTYYWKVTEVNAAEAVAEWQGDVWTFTVENYGPIDDFESYTDDIDAEQTIWQAWVDGLTTGASGSQVGYTNAPFAERTTVHGGKQSMPLTYDNSVSPFYSEAERTFDSPQDWTDHGADSLCVYFQGAAQTPANSAEGLYLTVKDSSGKSKTVANPNASATTTTSWQQWKIPLSEFTSAGVKMNAVKTIVDRRRQPDQPDGGRQRHGVHRRHRVRSFGSVNRDFCHHHSQLRGPFSCRNGPCFFFAAAVRQNTRRIAGLLAGAGPQEDGRAKRCQSPG